MTSIARLRKHEVLLRSNPKNRLVRARAALALQPLAVEGRGATVKHGGKRKGAGRKPTGRRPYLVRMKPATMAVLTRAAKPKTVGEYLDATYAP